jgi:hypothetical protein
MNDQWSEIAEMHDVRFNCRVVQVDDDVVLLIGGWISRVGTVTCEDNTIEEYSISKNAWR